MVPLIKSAQGKRNGEKIKVDDQRENSIFRLNLVICKESSVGVAATSTENFYFIFSFWLRLVFAVALIFIFDIRIPIADQFRVGLWQRFFASVY